VRRGGGALAGADRDAAAGRARAARLITQLDPQLRDEVAELVSGAALDGVENRQTSFRCGGDVPGGTDARDDDQVSDLLVYLESL